MDMKKIVVSIAVGLIFVGVIFTFYTTFSLENESRFESVVYQISDGYIEGISSNTDIQLFMKYFDLENCSMEVFSEDNKKVTSGYVQSGSRTVVYDSNHEVLSSYINVIQGDIHSDGVIDESDLKEMGKCLVQKCNLDANWLKTVDLDGDSFFHINDLVLLDKAITNGYQGITLTEESMVLQTNEQGRFVAVVEPSYGVNRNVKWVSMNEEIVSIDDAGRVTGKEEGETKIQALTLDGQFVSEAVVRVDNTIQLSSYEGIGYVGGDDVVVAIKLVDYEGVSCTSEDEDIASCEIVDKNLVMKANGDGKVAITVTSPTYGEAHYQLTIYSVYLNVFPKYFCTTSNNIEYITVSGLLTGELSFQASDSDLIRNAYMSEIYGRNMLRIEFGPKQGRVTLTVKESNGNTTRDVVIDVYSISIPEIGSVAKVGEEVSTKIAGDHFGTLSCVSQDENKATCRIEGNQLIVTPLATGAVTIDIYNQFSYNNQMYDCGKTQFLVVTQE